MQFMRIYIAAITCRLMWSSALRRRSPRLHCADCKRLLPLKLNSSSTVMCNCLGSPWMTDVPFSTRLCANCLTSFQLSRLWWWPFGVTAPYLFRALVTNSLPEILAISLCKNMMCSGRWRFLEKPPMCKIVSSSWAVAMSDLPLLRIWKTAAAAFGQK